MTTEAAGTSSPVVAIVGGGASGTLLAAQLLRRHHPQGLDIRLVERRDRVGRGVAYSTPYEYHRLNVPIEQMGALPRDPRHFMRWASLKGHGMVPGDFAPRGLFGEYLADLLAGAQRTALGGGRVTAGRDSVEEIERTLDAIVLKTSAGARIEADLVVLALGNLPPAEPPGFDPDLAASGHYVANPWNSELTEMTADDDDVLLLGTGLTMVDVALTIGTEGFKANVHAVSRKGMVPQRHRPGIALPPRRFQLLADRLRLDEMVERVAIEIADAQGEGGDWRQVIDSMRPVTNQIWRRLSEDDQRRFVEGLSRPWDVHRHRMAPEVAMMMGRMRRTGRLRIGQGSIESMELSDGRVEVQIRDEDDSIRSLEVDRVVNCTGPALDLAATRDPLLTSLFDSGLGRPGPLRLGLDHDSRGAVVAASGETSDRLFTIGPMRKGRLWETTAIPEIREQAFELADQITAALDRTSRRTAPAAA